MTTSLPKTSPDLPSTTETALAFFDTLPPVTLDEMIGRWRGAEVPTAHPLDGMLQIARWYGKEFESAEHVHPLIHEGYRGLFKVNPGLVPVNVPPILRHPVVGHLFRLSQPLLRTKRSKARLRLLEYRGVVSAAMVYDQKPINDVFRKLSDSQVFAAMDMKGMARPYFFTLTRDT